MFRDAADLYLPLLCSVGGGTPTHDGKLYGSGCLLTRHHVVTARHVWTETAKTYQWPVVLKYDGLYRCETLHELQDADLLILKCTHKVNNADFPAPAKYPSLLAHFPSWGSSVGFLTWITFKDANGEQTRKHMF